MRQEGVGEFLYQLALSLPLHQLMFSGDYALVDAFLASQSFAVSPIYLGSLIPET